MKNDIEIGAVISSDTDNFVRYCKFNKKFAVLKALFSGYEDSLSIYHHEIRHQTLIADLGFAPKVLKTKIKLMRGGRFYASWISEDAGLPIEEADVPEANKLLDELYDRGIILCWYVDQRMFVKGFDGKIRATDFKHTEVYDEPIGAHNRKYVKWVS